MKRYLIATVLAAGLALPAAPAFAQRGGSHAGGGHAVSGGHASSGSPHASSGAVARSRGAGAPTVGHAVPRGTVGPTTRPYRGGGYGYVTPYYGFYGPALGLGYYGYDGYYDPFWYDTWGYAYPGYGYAVPYVVPSGAETGGLRLEVKPDSAQVFVDGAYAGIVDDFDGHFQHLDLTPGTHHIEVRAPGYEPLSFDVAIQADHTTHYKGSLTPTTSE
jgi:hypothetical protein